jgi:uncharacterized membrane protein
MSAANKDGRRGFVALGRSYVMDLRGWALKLAAGYGFAAAFLIGGVLAVLAAAAVGAAALFHFIDVRYGENVAFAVFGSGLLALGMILLLAGWAMLRRRAAPFPRPYRQAQAAKRMVIGSAMTRAIAEWGEGQGKKPDLLTQVLVGGAAVLVVGWIMVSRLQSGAQGDRVQR